MTTKEEDVGMTNQVALKLYGPDGKLKRTVKGTDQPSFTITQKIMIGMLFIPVLLFLFFRGLYRIIKKL